MLPFQKMIKTVAYVISSYKLFSIIGIIAYDILLTWQPTTQINKSQFLYLQRITPPELYSPSYGFQCSSPERFRWLVQGSNVAAVWWLQAHCMAGRWPTDTGYTLTHKTNTKTSDKLGEWVVCICWLVFPLLSYAVKYSFWYPRKRLVIYDTLEWFKLIWLAVSVSWHL